MFLVEGSHCVEALLDSNWELETVMAAEDFDNTGLLLKVKSNRLERVGRKTIARIASVKTPQDIVAVAKIPEIDLDSAVRHDRILVVDNVKDPGNLGAMIRTAEALGFDSIVTIAGTVDIYNPKVVRATQGAMFSEIIAQRVDPVKAIERIGLNHVFYSLAVDGDIEIAEASAVKNPALVVGSEISGVGQEFLETSKYRIKIPISGKSESLNAAVAAGIAMYFLRPR